MAIYVSDPERAASVPLGEYYRTHTTAENIAKVKAIMSGEEKTFQMTIGGRKTATPPPITTTTPTTTTTISKTTPKDFEFSGKVEEFEPKTTEPSKTRFFVRGAETGILAPGYAKTKKPSKFIFEKEGEIEEIEFTKEGATIEKKKITPYEMYVGRELEKPGIIKAADFLFGETGKRYVGIGGSVIPPIVPSFEDITIKRMVGKKPGEAYVTFKEVGGIARERLGMPGKVFAELLPTTPAGVTLTVAGVGLYGKLPQIARIGAGTTLAVFEGKKVFDPSLPTEKRIAGGLVGGLGATGAVFEGLPFARGVIARFSPKYAPIKTAPEGFKAIKTKEFDVGLILEKAPLKAGITKDVKLPRTSPLVKGGFGRKPGGEKIFLGEKQYLATSQRGFFKAGKDIILEREFYVTPQEPFIKIPETRISRLGLSDLFEISKEAKIGFGIPSKPQIGIMKGAVRRVETPKAFELGKGTELEAIKTYGAITGIKKIGVTTLRGQAVDIYQFGLGKPTGTFKQIRYKKPISTRPTTRVSGETTLSLAGISRALTTKTIPTKQITTGIIPSLKPTITTTPTKPISPPLSPPPTPRLTTRLLPSHPLTKVTPPITPIQVFPTKLGAPPKIRIGVPVAEDLIRATRRFVQTPSLGVVLGKELGLDIKGLKAGFETQTGLFEREFKQVRFKTPTLLREVKKIEKPKIKEFYI